MILILMWRVDLLTHGAPLARFARESSAIIKWPRKNSWCYLTPKFCRSYLISRNWTDTQAERVKTMITVQEQKRTLFKHIPNASLHIFTLHFLLFGYFFQAQTT